MVEKMMRSFEFIKVAVRFSNAAAATTATAAAATQRLIQDRFMALQRPCVWFIIMSIGKLG